jgi:FkbM family methyltransferase
MTASLRAAVRTILPQAVSDKIFSAFLRRRALRRVAASFPVRTVTHEYGGVQLSVSIEDPVGDAWYDCDWPLNEVGELRRRGLDRGAVAFDLGAHQAVVALVLADAVGSRGRVVAVEPERHNVRVAQRNIALNHASNVTVVQAAVAERAGTVRFEEAFGGRIVDGGRGAVEVPSLTVDELAAQHGQPDVVFVDVEGAEAAVLAGARETLARGQAAWFVEVHDVRGEATERFGGTRAVLQAFAPDHYELLYSCENDHRALTFAPLTGRAPDGRFFLIAAPRRAAAA